MFCEHPPCLYGREYLYTEVSLGFIVFFGIINNGSSLDDRSAFKRQQGGKSGQHRIRQSLTATGGDPRESATETKLPEQSGKDETSRVRAYSIPW